MLTVGLWRYVNIVAIMIKMRFIEHLLNLGKMSFLFLGLVTIPLRTLLS